VTKLVVRRVHSSTIAQDADAEEAG
jgi:hypothetical protein